ncbi:hypothetical protein [Marinobacter salsuginis]|uniref:hypothetical protein n=1 Tax=Marinobacter salsuginis TaxID=418719 RepID=UPI001ADF025E|nr:hypothetical protein [Marinobacter salsuginis]QTN42029.1 hypothetical protein HZ997_01230 [Marinobacter salsuginis]
MSAWFLWRTLYPGFYTRCMTATVYIGLHYLVGFYVLWVGYNTLYEGYLIGTSPSWGPEFSDSQPDLKELQYDLRNHVWLNSFDYKSGIETVYLVTCVVWGNIGWDRLKSIFKERNGRRLYQFFVLETSLVVTIFAIATASFTVWMELVKGVWSADRDSNQILLFALAFLLIIFAIEIIRSVVLIPRKMKKLPTYVTYRKCRKQDRFWPGGKSRQFLVWRPTRGTTKTKGIGVVVCGDGYRLKNSNDHS